MTYNTEKRAELIKFLCSSHGESFTIEQICERLLSDGRGKSTIYRLVSRLVEDGSVRKISDPRTRHVTYQYIHTGRCSEHLHLKCKECGKLVHLDEETTQIFESRIKSTSGFALDDGALLFGTCDSCAPKAMEVGEK